MYIKKKKSQRVKIKFYRSKAFVLLGYLILERPVLSLLKSLNIYLGMPKSRAPNNYNTLQISILFLPKCNGNKSNHNNNNNNHSNNNNDNNFNNDNNKTTNSDYGVATKNNDSNNTDSLEESSWQVMINTA